MYERIVIVPYTMGSASAKALKQELKQLTGLPTLLVRKTSTKYQPRWTDYVINWGCSKEWPWINLNNKVGHTTCVNKLKFFQAIDEHNKQEYTNSINIPEWTTDTQVASNWDTMYLARTKLDGHSGDGIIICEPNDEVLPSAPLYVKYKKKRHEYRVHFFKSKTSGEVKVIDVTQKKKRKGAENLDTKIRNHQNGWIYAREDITEPDDLRAQALLTASVVDLDFGAVDLIWNEHENKCYVLEVNTAPGLIGTTLNMYTQAIVQDILK